MGTLSQRNLPKVEFNELIKAAVALSASGDYRVLSRLKPQRFYGDADGKRLIRGLIVDTETTGLDPEHDQIIECAILPFTFTEDGVVVEVLVDEAYVGLQDPCRPLSRRIQQATGFTDDVLEGQVLDFARIAELAASAKVVIAHNASFDRPLMERACPAFEKKIWLCSQKMIPWHDEGMMGEKLEYILSSSGYFYDAHRAMTDCEALLFLLAQPLPISDQMPLAVMLREVRREIFVSYIPAQQYNQEVKDRLYRLGYDWINEPGYKGNIKVIAKDAASAGLAEVMALLKKHNMPAPQITPLSATDFFSARATCKRFKWVEALSTVDGHASPNKHATAPHSAAA